MKRVFASLALVTALLVFHAPAGAQDEHPAMRMDDAAMQRWVESFNAAPKAYIDPAIKPKRGSKSVLPYLVYNAAARQQGECSNCWAWTGTGIMEVALAVQNDIFDRLSVQYLNSCESSVISKACCDTGTLENVQDFYRSTGKAIPWTNSGASWQDGDGLCDTACGSISTSPSYTVDSIQATSISTHSVGKETAIYNIKNVLNQNKAVWFAFFVSNQTDWNTFSSFWSNQSESASWSFDYARSKWPTNRMGHAVLCVGYNDDDPSNRYWIILNSWGAPPNRPAGLFRLNMDINYDCQESGTGYYNYWWQTLDVSFDSSPSHSYPVRVDPAQTSYRASSGDMYLYASMDYITTWVYPFVRLATPSGARYYLTSRMVIYPYPQPYTPYAIQTTGAIDDMFLCRVLWKNLAYGTYYVESGAVDAEQPVTSGGGYNYYGEVYRTPFTLY